MFSGPLTEGGEASGGDADDNNDVVVGSTGEPAAPGPSTPADTPADPPAYQPPSNPSPPQQPHYGFQPQPTDVNSKYLPHLWMPAPTQMKRWSLIWFVFFAVADKLPSPPIDPETKNPGGFQPYTGPSVPVPSNAAPVSYATLTADQMSKAQKYCKYAGSALNFDDVKSAIENLEKALYLLNNGQEKP